MLMYVVYRWMYGAVDYILIFRDVLKIGAGTLAMVAVLLGALAHVHILPLIALGFVSYMVAELLLREREAQGYLRLGLRLLARLGTRS